MLTVNVSGIEFFEKDGAEIYIHIWYTDKTGTEWFGEKMTKVEDGIYTYQVDVQKTVEGVVIVRVGTQEGKKVVWNQTNDLTVPEGHVITLSISDIQG